MFHGKLIASEHHFLLHKRKAKEERDSGHQKYKESREQLPCTAETEHRLQLRLLRRHCGKECGIDDMIPLLLPQEFGKKIVCSCGAECDGDGIREGIAEIVLLQERHQSGILR